MVSRHREAPTLDEMTAAVQNVCDVALFEVTVTQDGHPSDLSRLVRAMDHNGLIDWSGVGR